MTETTGHQYAYLRDYHTNIRHHDNPADCRDCAVGKCDVPHLLTAFDALLAAAQHAIAACPRCKGSGQAAFAWTATYTPIAGPCDACAEWRAAVAAAAGAPAPEVERSVTELSRPGPTHPAPPPQPNPALDAYLKRGG